MANTTANMLNRLAANLPHFQVSKMSVSECSQQPDVDRVNLKFW